jgi:hypothetical protein
MNEETSRAQVLIELRNEQESLLDFGDALDAKLNMLVGSGSLILGLFSTFNMIQPGPPWYWVAIIVAGVAYFALLFWLGFSLSPKTYHFPLKADWDHLYATYIPLEGDELLDTMISQNIEAIEKNKAINSRKALAVCVGLWALPIMLVVLAGCRLTFAAMV